MTAAAQLPLRWTARATPLRVGGLLARGPVRTALLRALLSLDDRALASVRGVGSADLIALLGDADALPWVDGGEWLGRDPEAPSLWLPTACAPDVPIGLFERAVLARVGAAETPLAVVPGSVVSLSAARPVQRARLAALARGGVR